jgi:hypothetical protein
MKVLSTGFPWVEGSPLLILDSEFSDGTFTLQYLFPIRGIYTFDLEITSVPEGPAFPPTSLRKTVRISENPVVVRNAWLLIGGLLIFGGIIGTIFARSAAAREKRLSCAIVSILLLYCGALGPVNTVAAHGGHTEGASYTAPERQVIQGDDGWELEIHSSPMPAIVGHLVQLAIWLRKDGEVFPGMTKVMTAVTSLEKGQTVVETSILARQGHAAQSLQLYDGTPHTIAVTVRPVGSDARGWLLPTAVLNVDVVALPPPFAVQLRMLAMLVGVLVVGMVVGFCAPRMYKAPT